MGGVVALGRGGMATGGETAVAVGLVTAAFASAFSLGSSFFFTISSRPLFKLLMAKLANS